MTQRVVLLIGITTLAFVFERGVMVAVDDVYISQSASELCVENAIYLNSHMLAVCLGEIADYEPFLRALQSGGERCFSVKEASKWVVDTLCSSSDYYLSLKLLIVGWEKKTGTPHLYVDSKGNCIKAKSYISASASTFTYGGLMISDFFYERSYKHAAVFARNTILSAAREVAFNRLGTQRLRN
ncbi:OLC1v1008867C1 [Oldenlandia corymbosa var. corymbosa]|uniref:OLC1v1008867C1 n=1 Tax=Oldenlandia corymbosa var. corymbosa TaxID=529605 RepID=A0AAV1DP40_OLDCO|nr:OLC1v1008867C1 [Oldenlandia corymbosa var. corymbosa]